ncbi:CU044_2847 family protein [Solirubrobacter soli]|uniref:CU044_2847 family protein n=1 Tax=Solirubrobacter soli TaxID=363832 RepID=UPI0003F71D96|nr:CU044_2847 family protein [Solirubrobacter soli]
MTEIARFTIDEAGGDVLVEVDKTAGLQRVARGDDGIYRATERVDAALAAVTPAARRVLDAVKEIAPSSTEVEFGIKLTAEAGAILAKASGEAHFTVKMSWEHK